MTQLAQNQGSEPTVHQLLEVGVSTASQTRQAMAAGQAAVVTSGQLGQIWSAGHPGAVGW